jgi:hypothetical protein
MTALHGKAGMEKLRDAITSDGAPARRFLPFARHNSINLPSVS